jgi:YidC/Oxa1 family membrane protein insertase
MDRNLILAIVLSVLIIVVFQYFFQAFSPPPPPKKVPAPTEAPGPAVPTPVPAPAVPGDQPRVTAPETAPLPSPVKPAPEVAPVSIAKETLVKIDTPKYEATISSKGARIVSFKLKDYRVSMQSEELVNLFAPEGLDTSGPSIMFTRRDETFNDASLSYNYDSPETSVSLTEKGAKKSITFKTSTAAGIGIAKTFVFNSDNYDVGFSFTLSNNSNESRNYLITLPWRKAFEEDAANRFSWNSVEILLNGELKDYYFKDIKGDEEPSGKVEWAGLGDVYFFKALIFGKNPAGKVTLFKPTKENVAEIWVRYGGVDIPQGQAVTTDLSLYLGPKERQALNAAGHDLSRALFYSNYKVLDVISEYLMIFLRFCNSGFEVAGIRIPGTHNYGWDIILLTILTKILFIPLTHKSMKSMKRMQDLQPQLAKLREKYKDDKAAMNKATMDLFREQKVNPLGGCWPMFLQLPVFIALYQALSYAIELRLAPFVCVPSIFLCINDLSAPDPYYVTPILMGGTMVLQQWMTPSGGDPTQKKMMLIMPVVFTYLFLSFPSGLVLYWLVSNVLSIGQQLITNKMAK